jgi:ParB/RepB/Spo0J family partition protein
MLKPVVLQNLELLRQIRDWPGDLAPTAPDLAKALDRDVSNTRKSIKALIDEGLIAKAGDGHVLTAEADRALQDLARSLNGVEPSAKSADGIAGLLWDQIWPDPDNNRRDWTSEEAQEDFNDLVESIAERGLLQNLIVRPNLEEDLAQAGVVDANGVRLPTFILIGGERRWRSIGRLIETGRWDRFKPIPCQIRSADPREAALDALAENMKRRDLKPLEEARAFKRLVDEHNVKTAEIAAVLKCSQRVVQQRMQLLELDEKDQARLESGELKLEEARRIIADRPDPLTPEQVLVLAELAAAFKWKSDTGVWNLKGVKVRQDLFKADPNAEVLVKRVLISCYRDGESQLFEAKAQFEFQRCAKTFLKGWDEDPKGTLDRIRTEVLGQAEAIRLKGSQKGAKTFATDWLNGPFEIDEEGKELLARRAERAAQAKLEDEERAQREKFRLQLVACRRRDVDQLQTDLRQFITGAPRMEDFAALANNLSAPLPWWIDQHGSVRNAEGGYVQTFGFCYGEGDSKTLQILAVTAINAAAGLGTPLEAPNPPAVADSEDGGELTDDEAAAISAEMRAEREAFAAELAEA